METNLGAASPLFTVICLSNDPGVLGRFLLKSLEAQTLPYELRVVDTTRQKVASCAAGLNAAAREARGKYLVFVHHDVALVSPDFLAQAAGWLETLPDVGIAGAVGMSDRGENQAERGRGRILCGEFPGRIEGFTPVERPEVVQTLDELLVIIPAEVHRRLPFDESVCDDWHLYAVDYCLSVRRLGLQAYVLPMLVHHLSGGGVNRAYFRTLAKVVRKHRQDYLQIFTTCDPWTTRGPRFRNAAGYYLRRFYRDCKGAVLRVMCRL